jgi:hypothetical protein
MLTKHFRSELFDDSGYAKNKEIGEHNIFIHYNL